MCGIIGVFKHDGSANIEIYEGLLMLQHRGQVGGRRRGGGGLVKSKRGSVQPLWPGRYSQRYRPVIIAGGIGPEC